MDGCKYRLSANSCRSGEHTCTAGLGRKAVIQRPPVIGNHAPIAAARQLPYLFEGDRAFWLTPMDITVMPNYENGGYNSRPYYGNGGYTKITDIVIMDIGIIIETAMAIDCENRIEGHFSNYVP